MGQTPRVSAGGAAATRRQRSVRHVFPVEALRRVHARSVAASSTNPSGTVYLGFLKTAYVQELKL